MDNYIFELIEKETIRQNEGIELIASENYTSKFVRMACGSILTNKYAEGYPDNRYYGGCEVVDQVEKIAIERVCKLLVLNMQMFNLTVAHKRTLLLIERYFQMEEKY